MRTHGRRVPPALSWILRTLPLGLASLVILVGSEWLFFATTPSSLSILPLSETIRIALDTPAPFVPALAGAQLAFTLLSILVSRAAPRRPATLQLSGHPSHSGSPPRDPASIASSRAARVTAAVPAGVVLACTGFLLIDNFTYVVMGFASIQTPTPAAFSYVVVFLLLTALSVRWVAETLRTISARRAGVFATSLLWLIAAPSIAGYFAGEYRRPIPAVGPDAPAATPSGGPQLPNILILTFDGVNARQLSVYGHSVPTSPTLTALREESLFFENAFSNAAKTQGALTSLLTGKLPTETFVTFPPTILRGDARFEHLPRLLGHHGYQRLQLTMRHYSDAEDSNMLGAFDLANYRWERMLSPRVLNEAADPARHFRNLVFERLTDRLLYIAGLTEVPDHFAHVTGSNRSIFWGDDRRVATLLEFIQSSDRPWFAQVHFTDTHEGQWPHLEGGVYAEMDGLERALRAADEQLRVIVESLRVAGILDETILVVGSDHNTTWTTRQRVPLLIRFPGGAHRRVEKQNVQLLDVAPTLLDYLDIAVPEWMAGTSLLESPPDRPIISISRVGREHATARFVHVLSDPGPPNHGVSSAAIILGSRWHELDLDSGAMTSGDVEGHTAPRLVDAEVAWRILKAHLRHRGFVVNERSPRPPQSGRLL